MSTVQTGAVTFAVNDVIDEIVPVAFSGGRIMNCTTNSAELDDESLYYHDVSEQIFRNTTNKSQTVTLTSHSDGGGKL